MTFLAAPWLWLLLPWSLLAIWVWRRVAQQHAVTARFLWADHAVLPARTAVRRRPPMWVVLILLSLLMTIAALAGLAVNQRLTRVAIVVDPAVSLSARIDGQTLLNALVDRVLRDMPADAQVSHHIAGQREAATPAEARSPQWTARSTDAAVRATVRKASEENDVVVALTDKRIDTGPGGRVVVITPATKPANTGIESVSVSLLRGAPDQAAQRGQAMVRLANFGPARQATLRVGSGDPVAPDMPSNPAINTAIDLPAGASTRFVDIDPLGPRVEVNLIVGDDPLPIDNVATLLRSRSWPQIAIDGAPPAAATRFAAIYSRQRPGDGEAVWFTSDPAVKSSAIFFASASAPAGTGALTVSDHPVLREVSMEPIVLSRRAVPPAEAEGWTAIASVGGAAILAVRESPARQVWVGFEPDPGAVSSVVLLSNATDWVSGVAAPQWLASTPDDVGADWQAISGENEVEFGVKRYRNGVGEEVAVNVPVIKPDAGVDVGDVRGAIIAARHLRAVSLGTPLAVGAAFLLAIAVGLLRRGRFS